MLFEINLGPGTVVAMLLNNQVFSGEVLRGGSLKKKGIASLAVVSVRHLSCRLYAAQEVNPLTTARTYSGKKSWILELDLLF